MHTSAQWCISICESMHVNIVCLISKFKAKGIKGELDQWSLPHVYLNSHFNISNKYEEKQTNKLTAKYFTFQSVFSTKNTLQYKNSWKFEIFFYT